MKHFVLDHGGHRLEVEVDQGAVFWYRARLVVDGEPVDERALLLGDVRLRTARPRPLVVEATAGWLGPKRVVLRDGAEVVPFVRAA